MQNKKWLSILIAVAISVGLWVYVVAVKNPEGEMELNNVPVFFAGEDVLRDDHDLILTDSNIANGVTLTFFGKLSDLNKLRDGKSDLAVTVNVNHLRNAQTYTISYDLSDVTLPSSVSASNVELHQVSPKAVEITVGKSGQEAGRRSGAAECHHGRGLYDQPYDPELRADHRGGTCRAGRAGQLCPSHSGARECGPEHHGYLASDAY